jgi:hypothetical protein
LVAHGNKLGYSAKRQDSINIGNRKQLKQGLLNVEFQENPLKEEEMLPRIFSVLQVKCP